MSSFGDVRLYLRYTVVEIYVSYAYSGIAYCNYKQAIEINWYKQL